MDVGTRSLNSNETIADCYHGLNIAGIWFINRQKKGCVI